MKMSEYLVLAILTIGYIAGELGHFLIGTTTKAIATDLHYGDISCQRNVSVLNEHQLPRECSTVVNEQE
jgi:hypothetical protein